ncbi:hypothetical protein DYD21_17640 [Rhodohalobacter sp. SW132]|uniref:hypothetical protein n=1 Tax=Rhodohalobacter sp. SW132 TaxID=2293433 RepID=UPI000E261F83|nr:hypothetical protein [Rhodohalobacter sp. SW132]REL24678.1 hypothetical protein DYD21_17640 [Rhodohalobacter sp. SW132]
MRNLAILVLSIFMLQLSSNEISAQVGQEINTYQMIQDLSPGYMERFEKEIDADGSPYLFNEFLSGSLTFMNGKTVSDVPLRFNIHEENVQFQNNGNIFVLDAEVINKIEITGQNETITLQKGFDARRLSENNFVEILADGDAKFMVKYSATLRQANANYGASANTNEFSTTETYYVKFGNEDTERLRRLNERRVLRVFPDHSDEIEQFVNNNNLQLDNADDVAALFKYYNSL